MNEVEGNVPGRPPEFQAACCMTSPQTRREGVRWWRRSPVSRGTHMMFHCRFLLVADHEPALKQHRLDVSLAEGQAVTGPQGVSDDAEGKRWP